MPAGQVYSTAINLGAGQNYDHSGDFDGTWVFNVAIRSSGTSELNYGTRAKIKRHGNIGHSANNGFIKSEGDYDDVLVTENASDRADYASPDASYDIKGRAGFSTYGPGSTFNHQEDNKRRSNFRGGISYNDHMDAGGLSSIQYSDRQVRSPHFNLVNMLGTKAVYVARTHSGRTDLVFLKVTGTIPLVITAGATATSSGRIIDPIYETANGQLASNNNMTITWRDESGLGAGNILSESFSIDVKDFVDNDWFCYIELSDGTVVANTLVTTANTRGLSESDNTTLLEDFVNRNVFLATVRQRNTPGNLGTRATITRISLRKYGRTEILIENQAFNQALILTDTSSVNSNLTNTDKAAVSNYGETDFQKISGVYDHYMFKAASNKDLPYDAIRRTSTGYDLGSRHLVVDPNATLPADRLSDFYHISDLEVTIKTSTFDATGITTTGALSTQNNGILTGIYVDMNRNAAVTVDGVQNIGVGGPNTLQVSDIYGPGTIPGNLHNITSNVFPYLYDENITQLVTFRYYADGGHKEYTYTLASGVDNVFSKFVDDVGKQIADSQKVLGDKIDSVKTISDTTKTDVSRIKDVTEEIRKKSSASYLFSLVSIDMTNEPANISMAKGLYEVISDDEFNPENLYNPTDVTQTITVDPTTLLYKGIGDTNKDFYIWRFTNATITRWFVSRRTYTINDLFLEEVVPSGEDSPSVVYDNDVAMKVYQNFVSVGGSSNRNISDVTPTNFSISIKATGDGKILKSLSTLETDLDTLETNVTNKVEANKAEILENRKSFSNAVSEERANQIRAEAARFAE